MDSLEESGYCGSMETVGIRQLKNNLSAYLRRVGAGEVIQVTDHGRVVAEIRQPSAFPPGYDGHSARFWEKVSRGEIKLAGQRPSAPFWEAHPCTAGNPSGTGRRLLDEDREEK